MKKLFTIGLSQCFSSIIPVMVWMIMGKLHGNAFANGMTYIYPYQFIFLLLWHITFVGNIKYELKDNLKTNNYSRTSIFVGIIIEIIILIISIYNIHIIGPFLGIFTDIDRWSFLFGLCSLTIDWPAYYLGEQYQYYGEEKKGTKLIITWYIIKLILVCLTAIPIFNYKSASVFILGTQTVLLIIMLIRHGIPQKIQFSIYNGMKYSIYNIFYNIFMTLIYLFGIHDMSVTDVSLLAAFNMMVLCTDMQWDVCGAAIDITVTSYVCDGTFDRDKKRIFKNNLFFSLLMTVSSYIMMGVMLLLYRNVNPIHVIIMITIELSTMMPYGIIDTMSAYINVQYPSIWTGLLVIVKYSVRIISQFIILSPYAINIALPVAVMFDLPFRVLLYRKALQKAQKTINC